MTTFSKETEKAIAAYQKAESGQGWKRAAAYVIIAPIIVDRHEEDELIKPLVGKIKILNPFAGEGKLQVFVWDCAGNDIQYGAASGYGYDKLSAALHGLYFDEIRFTDHPVNWETQLRRAGYTVIQAM